MRFLVSRPLRYSSAAAVRTFDVQHSISLNPWFKHSRRRSPAEQSDPVPIPVALFLQLLAVRADVIVAGDWGLRSVVALLAARLKRAKFVIWSEETPNSARGRSEIQHAIRRWLARRCDAVLAWSQEAVQYARDIGLNQNRIFRSYQTCDNDYWLSASKTLDRGSLRIALAVRGTVFLVVGRLLKLKGIHLLLDAWADLDASRQRQATLLIVGDGPEAGALLHQSLRLGLRNVRFLGHMSADRLVQAYVAADVFVLPSLLDVWALVVNEAMLCGLPVLGSRYAGACGEMLTHDGLGRVFDPLDRPVFAELLSFFVDSASSFDRCDIRRAAAVMNPKLAARGINQMIRALA
ncbi:MAG: glycosyltransferase family 4 protein [Steroidobacteraceae bacterium]